MNHNSKLVSELTHIPVGDGSTANVILSQFLHGRPIEELRDALSSDNPQVVRHAIWIAAELGIKARELVDAVIPQLGHPTPYVRNYALEVMLVCAGPMHGAGLTSALLLLDDESKAIRHQVLYFWAKANSIQFAAASDYLATLGESKATSLVQSIRWLMSEDAMDQTLLDSILRERCSPGQRLGVIAASRLGDNGKRLLSAIEEWEEDSLRDFVRDWLAK